MRHVLCVLLLAGCAAVVSAEEKRVTVKAEGINRDDAVKQALRKALEQGAGTQIASFSNVENFTLIRDAIFSRASGIVKDYKIDKEQPGAGGTVVITLTATVSTDAVAKAWGEVQNVLDQLGRPTIAVIINEKIDGVVQEESMVENKLNDFFTRQGFIVKDRRALAAIAQREMGEALEANNVAKIQRYSKDAGASIFIHGSASADQAGMEDLFGIPAAAYNCSVQASVYYTDTGEIVGSSGIPQTRGLVRGRKEFNPQAARTALENATFPSSDQMNDRIPMARDLYVKVMEKWAEQISGGGNIELEVERIDFRGYAALKKALDQELRKNDDQIKIAGDFTRNTALFRIRGRMTAENLAIRLTDPPFDEWIDIRDVKMNRIQAVAKVTQP
jgi:hypothetical protein